jgi:ketosteroid isomerase-like protein
MSTERNKQLTAELFERFAHRDIAGVLGRMSDDLSYWIAGKPGTVPTRGTWNKKQMARLFENMMAGLEGGLAMTVKGMIAEGDRVAVELEGRGTLKNGRVYENEYHILLTFRDGKVCAVREYLDTQHVYDTWFRPEAA